MLLSYAGEVFDPMGIFFQHYSLWGSFPRPCPLAHSSEHLLGHLLAVCLLLNELRVLLGGNTPNARSMSLICSADIARAVEWGSGDGPARATLR